MKNFLVMLSRLVLIAAPVYFTYEIVTGTKGSALSVEWWVEHWKIVLTVAGGYLLMLLVSIRSLYNWFQTLVLVLGTAAIVSVYALDNAYELFSSVPYSPIKDSAHMPYVPYGLCLIVAILNSVFKRRYRAPKPQEKKSIYD